MLYAMDVSDAVARRVSIRAFKPDPVPRAQVAALLEAAGRAPSGGNLAPWRVYALSGEPLAALKAAAAANPMGEAMDYAIYPPSLWDPYRRRRFEGGEALYETLGIPRGDRIARLTQLMRNGELFGAPVGVFVCIDRKLGPPQWSDLGMYIQTFLLLAEEQGLATCAQEYWARYPRTLARLLDLPEEMMVFCGVALGWADESHPINSLRTSRDPADAWLTLLGFDGEG
jgi:nitroreductase